MARLLVIFSFLLTSVLASSDITYQAKASTSLSKIFSICNSEITQNLSLNIDLSTAMHMIDPSLFEASLYEQTKVQQSQKKLLTFTYRF